MVMIFYDSFGRVVKLCQIKSTGWAIYELLDSELKRWTYLNHSFSFLWISVILFKHTHKRQVFFSGIYGYIVFFITDFEYGNDCMQNVQLCTQNTTWTSFWKIHYVCTNCVLLRHNKWNFLLFIHPWASTERHKRMIWFLECKSVNSQFT